MRRQGRITSVTLDPRIGSYGLIESDGEVFVWTAGEFFRDGTHIVVGEEVFFDPTGSGYAKRIGAPMSPLAALRTDPMSLINADVYTTEGRRIGRVLVEREFLTLGRSVRFARRRPLTVRVEDLPHMAEPLPLVTADVERMHGAPGLRTSDPVEHWTDVASFRKATVHSLQ